MGSTFTKGALIDTDGGELLATAEHPTTLDTDVLDGVAAVRAAAETAAGGRAGEVLACSSAGGGLRLAVVGYERQISAEAGRRVGLTAGARVVHVHAGALEPAGVRALRAAAPDVVLLTGGTDGGNADVLLANARRLAAARLRAPLVLAGNADAADSAAGSLRAAGRRVCVVANVLPAIGTLEPEAARTAIREAFLRHVIGGKRLSRGPRFGRMVRCATPDAMLTGVGVLAGTLGADVLVVDVGGATTDVYSVLAPAGQDAVPRREAVPPLWRSRTVEGDLGVRWNAPAVLAAARAEAVLDHDAELAGYAARVAACPRHLPGPGEGRHDQELARAAALVAVRRHARPAGPGAASRPLRDVRLVLGGGGVLRHATAADRDRVLVALIGDHAGGWPVPDRAAIAVDSRYLLFAAGLLADRAPMAAARIAGAACA